MTDPLTIGINVFFQHSFFSSGLATVAISLADALKRLGHRVILVNTAGKQDWYEDCDKMKNIFERRNMVEWTEKGYDKLDIFVDIDGFIIPAERYKIAKKVVVFYRRPPFLAEQESTVYPIQQPVRNMRDCDAVWTWNEYSSQDVHILELLSGRPVYRVPYTWSPLGTESHTLGYPGWSDTVKHALEGPWACHIAETNTSMASNSTFAIVALAYTKTHAKDVLLKQYFIHNTQNIEPQQFFKENIMAHCHREGLEPQFVGRQRIGDWRLQPKSFVMGHLRFMNVKGMLLDAVWNGIPLIHNSPFLKSIGHGLERLYYTDNSIREACQAIQTMDSDFKESKGFFAPEALQAIRGALSQRLDSVQHRDVWNHALRVVNQPAVTIAAPAAPVASVQPLSTSEKSVKTHLRIGFSDMWQSANCNYNFWTLLLTEAGRRMTPQITVEGVQITAENAATEKIDLLFFTPFGNVWKQVPSTIPKIHITGENSPSNDDPQVYMNFGFDATDLTKRRFRFPLWTQYIDWFGANQDRLVNPRTLPLDSVLKCSYKAADRSKFAAFIVSNPYNKTRISAFEWLSQYKKVDSAGRLLNNVGNELFVENAGGGGGELKKHEFLKNYKFCFAYENSRGDGYVTEKLLAAKAAGCVPLYWGDLNVGLDFPNGGFINCNDFTTAEQLIEAVKALDTNDALWEEYANKPAIVVDVERKRLADVARIVLQAVVSDEQLKTVPLLLGASSSAEASTLGVERGDIKVAIPETLKIKDVPAPGLERPLKEFNWNGKTLLVTYATNKFLDPLVCWLETSEARWNSTIRARVYLGDDIEDMNISLLQSHFPSVEFLKLPTKTVSAPFFDDLWEPQHFAWKLWIYQQLVQEAELANTLIWYMDCASVIVRWPTEWLDSAVQHGICMLEDAEQQNYQWCKEMFCLRLKVTQEELFKQQIVGGIMAFIAGAKAPWKLFTEAWILGQQRDIIVGPKWSGIHPNGKPYGHRHDQSILSILRLRHNIPVLPLASVYNHESVRRCFKSGACLYIHRGQYKEHENFAPRIGEVHIISLKRREDRIKRFKENHEAWTKDVCLRPAYDGRRIELTPAIASLFKPNDFLWKKAVMGCALSHLSLWTELAAEGPVCENYLILEDDVKFKEGWLKIWEEASKHIPQDYDVLYLGGVLPPNREAFNHLVEPVNLYWNRVKENKIFGQRDPTRYFHFCNYAYILSRRGAKKVLDEIARRGGYYTSADHMICNRVDDMKHYVINPIVAGCYQDDDPKYQTSQFNNFNRVDGFDSDLWNNDERFTEEDIRTNLAVADGKSYAVTQVLQDAIKATLFNTTDQTASSVPSWRFATVGDHKIVPEKLLEYSWLRELFGSAFETIQQLPASTEPVANAVYIYMVPHYDNYLPLFEKHEAQGKPFYVLHLSDERGRDPIPFYSYKTCKQVVRVYQRPDVVDFSNVYTIPLGPYRRSDVQEHSLKGRGLAWNFFGTGWMGREAMLESWKTQTPNAYKFFDSWMDAKQLNAADYTQTCLNTYFMPCPPGQNVETFRLYEALDHGCIPIYVRQPGDEQYFQFLNKQLPIVGFQNWEQPLGFIKNLFQNNTVFVQYYDEMKGAWKRWRERLTSEVRQRLNLQM